MIWPARCRPCPPTAMWGQRIRALWWPVWRRGCASAGAWRDRAGQTHDDAGRPDRSADLGLCSGPVADAVGTGDLAARHGGPAVASGCTVVAASGPTRTGQSDKTGYARDEPKIHGDDTLFRDGWQIGVSRHAARPGQPCDADLTLAASGPATAASARLRRMPRIDAGLTRTRVSDPGLPCAGPPVPVAGDRIIGRASCGAAGLGPVPLADDRGMIADDPRQTQPPRGAGRSIRRTWPGLQARGGGPT